MDTGRDDDAEPPAHSTGWAARRIGIAAATLRTWDRRYGVGPTGRTAGGHRRYLPHDLDRLDRMRRLMLSGLTTAEAARACSGPGSGPAVPLVARRTDPDHEPGDLVRELTEAALRLDQCAVESLIHDRIRRRGVVSTWSASIVPVLVELGDRYQRYGSHVAVEHLFTECTRAALSRVTGRRERWDGAAPVVLACPDQELHTLPLHAVAAALAEIGCPSRLLGASVPVHALVHAMRQLAPRAVFLWAQTPTVARLADLAALPRRRPSGPVVVGGPGWDGMPLPASATRVHSLAAAIAALSGELIVSAS